MGAACSCLGASKAQGEEATVGIDGCAGPEPSGAAAAAVPPPTGVVPRPSLGRHSWYSAGEGWETGSEGDEFHDAMSELGDEELAEALAEWEAVGGHDPTVDRAIEVRACCSCC